MGTEIGLVHTEAIHSILMNPKTVFVKQIFKYREKRKKKETNKKKI